MDTTVEAAGIDEIVSMLSTLIGFPTTYHDSNLELIEYIRDHLLHLGIQSRLIFDRERKKANLLASLGPSNKNGIVLSGHTDVVSVEGQHWNSDPFTASLREHRLYGRGSCDMKGFIAVVLAQLPIWAKLPLQRPFHLAFSYDEEMGCLGVRSLVNHIKEAGIEAAGCIVGEPTNMKPVIAHKGRVVSHCCVKGKPIHSSLAPHGINAIEYAARLICFIRQTMDQEAEKGLHRMDFDVPYSTISTNVIQGGNSQNTIPENCEFTFDYRYLPGTNPDLTLNRIRAFKDQLRAEMKHKDAGADIVMQHDETCLPLSTSEQAGITELAKSLSHSEKTYKVAYGTEAGYFHRIGIPTVICGPGSIEQAHRPDEFVELAQLEACSSFMSHLGRSLCE